MGCYTEVHRHRGQGGVGPMAAAGLYYVDLALLATFTVSPLLLVRARVRVRRLWLELGLHGVASGAHEVEPAAPQLGNGLGLTHVHAPVVREARRRHSDHIESVGPDLCVAAASDLVTHLTYPQGGLGLRVKARVRVGVMVIDMVEESVQLSEH